MNPEEVYVQARMYRDDLRWSVIPVREDKKPAVKWAEFQTRMATDEEMKDWFINKRLGVGIVTGKLSNLCVVDIDSTDGEGNLREVSPEVFRAPNVSTPRGGRHLYHLYREGVGNKVGVIPGTDFRGEGGFVVAPPTVGPNGKPYTWNVPLDTLQDLPTLPDSYVNAVEKPRFSQSVATKPATMFVEGRRDSDLFHLAHTLVKGGMPKEEVLSVVAIAARACTPPMDDRTVYEKVESAIQRAYTADRNYTEEIRSFVAQQSGYFMVSEMNRELGFADLKQRKTASVIINRLVSEKYIEKYGQRAGVYRRIESELDEMDWLKSECVEFLCDLPLDLSSLVTVYPNNIIVVAGSPDSGKTAFMLDFVKRNMYKHNIHYFNSEMGDAEFRLRLQNHEDVDIREWKFRAYQRSSNFADVIKPADVNIIDFLEVSDAFYRVSAEINDIYRKLDGGICLIGLQKNRGQDLGRGGSFGLEKPRLYLSMDYGQIRITKAKNRRSKMINPNGWVRKYKLFGGAEFQPEGWWEEPGITDANTGKGVHKLF